MYNEFIMKIREAQQAVCKSGQQLLHEGYVAGTWGNVSQRTDAHTLVITPSGKPYESLSAADMTVVNMHTRKWQGPYPPSSEMGLHIAIYQNRPEIMAIVHTHQLYASTVAAARKAVPPILDDMAQIIGPGVRVTRYAHSNTEEINRRAVQALQGRMAVLLANHGAVCLGRTLNEAFTVTQVLEKSCQVFIQAQAFGGAKSLKRREAAQMHQFYLNNYSKK